MKRYLKQLLFTLFICGFCVSGFAFSSPEGYWKTYDPNTKKLRSIVQLKMVGGKLNGYIRKIRYFSHETPLRTCINCDSDYKDKPLVGLNFLRGLQGSGRYWKGGKVLNPVTGKTHKCKLTLSPSGKYLELRAYWFISWIGASHYWKRISIEELKQY